MRKYGYALLMLLASCAQSGQETNPASKDTVLIAEKQVSETRTSVQSEPAASYSERIPDELNDWKFSVELYETKRTFHYTVRVHAKEVRVTDSINIPNLNEEPKVVIRKGKEPLTCIIGFLDNKGEFKPYREVSFVNDRLRMHTLRTYSVGHYKTKVN